MIECLTHDQKLMAMEIIWRIFLAIAAGFKSPAWHDQVIQNALTVGRPFPTA